MDAPVSELTAAQFLAIDTGFKLADPLFLGLAFVGFALFVAIAALSHEADRAFSASIAYVVLGIAAAVVLGLADIPWLDPLRESAVLEHLSELALVIGVFASGLSLHRALSWRSWGTIGLLLVVVMPLTIALIAVFGAAVMGLSVGAAVILGAILAPTDPVLAGDVGLGPPGEEGESAEPRFSLTGEAAINDGLASPFVLLGVFVATHDDLGWLGEWAGADLLYGAAVAVVLGIGGGRGIAWLLAWLRERELYGREFDGWFAIATPLLVYGVTELIDGYGLLAVVAAAVAFRRHEAEHEYNRRIHAGGDVAKKFTELAVLLLLGSLITAEGLAEPGVAGWLLAPLLIVVIRPALVLAVAGRRHMRQRERAFLGWFGVRGVASLFYVAVVLEADVLSAAEEARVFWTVAACVLVSIVLHGASATPLTRRLLGHQEGPGPAPESPAAAG